MKRNLLAVGGLSAILGASVLAGVTAQSNIPAPARSSVNKLHTEKHPALMIALRSLNRAKTALTRADHDSAGHRQKARDLTEKAIAEVNLAISADKK